MGSDVAHQFLSSVAREEFHFHHAWTSGGIEVVPRPKGYLKSAALIGLVSLQAAIVDPLAVGEDLFPDLGEPDLSLRRRGEVYGHAITRDEELIRCGVDDKSVGRSSGEALM
jgi:hypothetical protein